MSEPPVDPDLLSGWKEIASWSGRSVRSVQRWERDLGLPVHRIKTPDGQSVYARRSELDAWRASLDVHETSGLTEKNGNGAEKDGGQTSEAGPAAASNSWMGRTLFVLAGLVIVIVAAALSRYGRGPSVASSYLVEGESVKALDAEGRLVWSYDVGYPIRMGGQVLVASPLQVDFQNDGHDELIVAIKHAVPQPGPREPDVLLCLDDTGQPCWALRPEQRFTCGSEEFAGPWQIGDVSVIDRDGRPKLWVSFVHHTWAPSFVLEVDADGSSRLLYFQPGWITTVARWDGAAGSYLVAGGVLNARQRASLVLVPVESLPASAPAEPGGYDCAGLPAQRPERMLVLPSFDAQVQEEPYPFVIAVDLLKTQLKGHYATTGGAGVVFEIDSALGLRRLARADSYWLEHRRFEEAGLLDHTRDTCPGRSVERDVQIWTPAEGWSQVSVLPNAP
jgi:hypothetical protein